MVREKLKTPVLYKQEFRDVIWMEEHIFFIALKIEKIQHINTTQPTERFQGTGYESNLLRCSDRTYTFLKFRPKVLNILILTIQGWIFLFVPFVCTSG